MKRKITFLLAALLLMSGLTWAQTTDVLNHTVIGVPSTSYVTWTDLTLTSSAVYAGNTAGGNDAIQMRSSNNNSGIVTTTSAGMVTNITVVWNSNTADNRTLNVYGSNTAYNAATDLYGNNAGTLIGTIPNGSTELEITDEYAFIGIRSASGALWLDEIQITWEEGGTPAPSISVENNNELAYNATSGSFNFTVNNPVSGGNMTVATEEEWISNPTVAGSVVNFTTTVNQAGAPREGIITLTYTYGEQSITKPVTITQAGNPNATMTIAEVRAQGTGAVATLGTVTSITGTTNKTAYIQDATAAIAVYGNFTAIVGDEIRVSGTLSNYNGLLEITNPVVTVVSSGNSINPELMTIAEINASTNQGWYVRVENATVTAINGQNTTIAQGDNTIVVRGISGVEYAVNDVLSLNGNIGYYNGNQIANPQNIEVQYNTEPSITITNDIINVPAEGDEDTIEVTYQNIIDITANVYFCDAEGNELEENPDWIYAEVDDDNNLYYNVEANDGAARTAYLKVVNVVGQTYTYSNLVTINQAQYVADYAILPFEFDGGRGDIVNTAGLTGYDLGSDYSSSPKLKFNNANETISSLILKFNEVPGPLTFDIKGNPSNGVWEGTFKVQTSEDGETYTDLATYTALTTTVQSESFDNLGENVRYIKWIYSEKVSGNVGVGNIHLYEFGGGPVVETYELTIEPFENLEIFTFVGDELTEPLEGAGTIQVSEGEQVMLSVSAEEGYVMQSLMVDGVEHVNDIDEDLTYTFVMPNHNVTVSATAVEDVPPTPFEPATYTLATSIEEGKTYIIVGKKTIDEEDEYYAMGEQRTNNRAGVAISCDGYTATVETADVHEFVIDAAGLEIWDLKNLRDGGLVGTVGWFSIYDTDGSGYLYAASSTANQLKTEAELDDNGVWAIDVEEEMNGLYSIVASGDNTHNVMQFNYNGGNTLFSCYTSDSQLPVYLYVKDETPTTLTQTIDLTAGVNYVSFFVETNLDDLKAALVDALGTSATIIVKSRVASTKYQRGRWAGNLSELNMAEMYKIDVPTDCEISLEGMPIDPTTLSVTITPGANWIAYPYTVEMTLPEFFGSFPVTNDVVKSKSQNSKYNRGRWAGSLTGLVPGQGYIYVSADDDAEGRTFTFPATAK